jgi:hypothetical protein
MKKKPKIGNNTDTVVYTNDRHPKAIKVDTSVLDKSKK